MQMLMVWAATEAMLISVGSAELALPLSHWEELTSLLSEQ